MGRHGMNLPDEEPTLSPAPEPPTEELPAEEPKRRLTGALPAGTLVLLVLIPCLTMVVVGLAMAGDPQEAQNVAFLAVLAGLYAWRRATRRRH